MARSVKFITGRPFYAVFEGEGGAGAGDGSGDGSGDKGAAGAGGTGNEPPKTFTQDQVNTFMKKEKEKATQERERLAKQLEDLGNKAKMSDEQRQTLENQIEELRTSNLTTEEKAKRSADKLKAEYDGKLTTVESESKKWQDRHNQLQIGYEINGAALKHEVLPQAIPFVESYLKPSTRLVEIDGEDGKGTGIFAAKVKLATKNKEGQNVTLDFTVDEALKAMKDDPDTFGHLFKGAAGGTGASSGTPSKKQSMAKLDTADYMAARKKNPDAVYQQ
jgi:hypothetical protein